MNDDELRARLRAADPARRDAPAESWIDELVEATVNEQENRTEETPSRSRWLVPGVAAAAVAAIAVGGYAFVAADDGGGAKDEQQTELALTVPSADPMTSMCIQFSAEALSPMEVAFAGTATDVTGDQVTLDVDHWYKGGDADVVEVTGSSDAGVLLEGGIEFTEGERYLVTATDGNVNGCGFSGLYTADMAAAFDQAFGG